MSSGSPSTITKIAEVAGVTGALITLGAGIYVTAYGASPTSAAYTAPNVYTYPSDLINPSSGRQFYFSLYFYAYQRPSVFGPVFPAPIGVIQLPLPSQLVDKQDVTWDEASFNNPAVGAALDASINAARNGGGAFTAGLTAGAQGSGAAATEALAATAALAAGESGGGAKALQLSGYAVNPYMTVLFKSPTFKRFVFTWKFIPNNQQESDNLKFILNKIRYHQLPGTNLSTTGGSLLNYPDMVNPVISPAGYMYSFKQCVIESSIVNYAPGVTPGFVSSNAPSAVELTLSLLEIEYWLKNDLTNSVDANYTIPSDVQSTGINAGIINSQYLNNPY